MIDITKLLARTRGLSSETINELLGTNNAYMTSYAIGNLKVRQLGNFCDYFKCQPCDLIDIREMSDCRWYLSLKNKDFSKLRELAVSKFGSVHKLCSCADVDHRIAREDYNMSLPTACAIAVTLGVRLVDIVEEK